MHVEPGSQLLGERPHQPQSERLGRSPIQITSQPDTIVGDDSRVCPRTYSFNRCSRLHTMKERCARWMLMTHDRARQDDFPLTQEFLADMLGVRRATVNAATAMLRKDGFIRYARGKFMLVDRLGLESATCSCYESIIQTYTSILGDPQLA